MMVSALVSMSSACGCERFGGARRVARLERRTATSNCNLGVFYGNGYGVPQDYAKAREWYEKAAAKDNALAM